MEAVYSVTPVLVGDDVSEEDLELLRPWYLLNDERCGRGLVEDL